MTDDVPTLVDPVWLASHLDDPDLRILDCTVHLDFDEETGERTSESGYADWAESHIPGSVYAPMLTDLSAENPDFPYELPSPDRFAAAMEELGVGDDSRVVVYDDAGTNWATRLWWMLRAHGFDAVGVLDGGWERWVDGGYPVSTDESEPPGGDVTFTPTFRPELVADKADVFERVDGDACIVNALRPEDHAGDGVNKYGRLGRIPGSVNVPAVGDDAIFDAETGRFQSLETLRERFEAAGAMDGEEVVSYCGGGIAATGVAFALYRLGVEDVAVYDGSLSEWASDSEMPMATGED